MSDCLDCALFECDNCARENVWTGAGYESCCCGRITDPDAYEGEEDQ